MAVIEARLAAMALRLPAPIKLPPGVTLSFPWVRVHADRAFVSGHGALAADGSIAHTPRQGWPRSDARAGLPGRTAHRAGDVGQPQGGAGRPRPDRSVAAGVRHGEHRGGLRPLPGGHQRLQRPHHGGVRCRRWPPRPASAVGLAGLPFNLLIEIEAEVAIKP